MSRLQSTQRKPTLKKRQDRDTSIGDRTSDDEANRRKQLQQLIQKDKQRKLLAINDLRKNNNQLDILRDLLLNERDIDELTQKLNGSLQLSRSDKSIPKNNTVRNGKNQPIKKTRPSSAKNFNSSGAVDWNQSEEDNLTADSADDDEPVRLSRSNRKNDQQDAMARSISLHSQSRQQPNGVRSVNNVSFISDVSKNGGKSNGTESNVNASSSQLKTLLNRLSSELNDLESITGFKPNKNDLSLNNQANTCSTALVTALITLSGHVKQCAFTSKEKQETNNLKNQLSVVIKAQLDFQQKIENQMSTLQTMMQTICQLVNNEIISSKKSEAYTSYQPSSRIRREQTDLEIPEPRQNWSSNVQRQSYIPKTTNNAMDELITFAQRMNNATPIDTNPYRQSTLNPSTNRHSAYIETLEASRKVTRPTSSMSTNETNDNDVLKHIQQRRSLDQESHSSMISPIDLPSSYDMFESGLPSGTSSASILRNGLATTTAPSASASETILEKILHERLRLVQQMAELNKQHEMTQEELANLEAKSVKQRTT